MTRASPRTPLHSSALVRQLADLAGATFPPSKQSIAEQLAAWLDVQDAITLSATLHPHTGRTDSGGKPAQPGGDPASEYSRVHNALREAILSEGTSQNPRTRLKLPSPESGDSLGPEEEFAPYQRYYVAHQRDMDSQITALRSSLRTALARGTPALRQLAMLDAALDKTLNERQRSLLASVPLLLERRFLQLRAAHREALTDAVGKPPPGAAPADGPQSADWLASFRLDLQQLLLAELEHRLQPVRGLLDAYRHDMKKTHP